MAIEIESDDVRIELSDDVEDRLREGERVDVCQSVLEPLVEGDEPGSMDVIRLEWRSCGVLGDHSLTEEYDDVIGLDAKVEGAMDDGR